MFGFRKKSPADRAIAIMPSAIRHASIKWRNFHASLVFKPEVGLLDQIAIFLVPMTESLRAKYSALKEAPDSIFLLIVAMAVERSGTHSRTEIQRALNIKLPG